MKFTEAKRKINLEKNGLLQKMPNTIDFITMSEFFWLVDYGDKENSEKITVPKNFITDFGSIPRFLWIFFDKTRFLSYILHDFMYSKKYKDFEEEKFFKQYFQEKKVTWELEEKIKKYVNKKLRKKADLILKEALKVEGMGFLKRNLVYLGVRLFGKKYFRK